ncbi:omega-hydroxypalmitate O-feruloyl transferase-like [Papaver somniferum]|uniref:omega-hydroxypalmitate O-feruloyl transferase-like n=1 Tax=Papaver somniferum TaxID=3469 RepID=UPI000E7033F2|nr:omega-hydroxypalmitate O-feruloyl transferase-like [Papaver somniferum]
MVYLEGGWKFDFRRDLTNSEVQELATLLTVIGDSPPVRDGLLDTRRWKLHFTGVFTVKSLYAKLMAEVGVDHFPHLFVWKPAIPRKEHLFLHCKIAYKIWSSILPITGWHPSFQIGEYLNSNCPNIYLEIFDDECIVKLNVKIIGEPTLVPPVEETPKGVYYLANIDRGADMIQTFNCFSKTFDGKFLDAAQALKLGLAKVLVHYYPIAGRLILNEKNKFAINCTGEGALFIEAEADCTLEEIGDLTQPNPATFKKLVYGNPGPVNVHEDPPLLVAQVTKFKCGGFTLGLSQNHTVFDGVGAMEFVISWGEVTRGFPLTKPPFLDRTILMARTPPQTQFTHILEEIIDVSNTNALWEEEKLLDKSFIFHPHRLERLREKAMEDGVLKKCTTFEVLTSIMWRARTKSLRLHPNQQVRLLFPVNARSRFHPPLPKGYFGKAIALKNSQCSVSELLESPLSSTIERFQQLIGLVTDECMRSIIDSLEEYEQPLPKAHTLFLSVWTRIGLHDMDFGWGEPIFAGPPTLPTNVVFFLPHGEERKGINLCLSLPVSSMKIFEEAINTID